MDSRRFLVVLLTGVSLFAGGFVLAVGQTNTSLLPYCSTTGKYSAGDQYHLNLFILTDNLWKDAVANDGFYYATEGETPEDRVFGLTMCYADRNWTDCQRCLKSAASGFYQVCPRSREMKAWYDACVLRYSNFSFFTIADLDYVAYKTTVADTVANATAMNVARSALMSWLVPEAASSSLRFANDSKEYRDSEGNSEVMYGLAQCTRDLNASECGRCLSYFISLLSTNHPNSTYGTVKGSSCYLAYQIGKDLGVNLLPPAMAALTVWPPAPAPSPLSDTPRPYYDKESSPQAGRLAALVAGITVGTFALVVCTAILVWTFRRKAREQKLDALNDEPIEDEFEKGTGPKRFSYSELAVATRFFSDAEKLGEGGFGSVYHGYLRDLDLHVAIKRVSKASKQGWKEYISEVKIISRLRHRNLVQLIGWCHDEGNLLLVYELMPNGSLDMHIHNENNVLSWRLRHEIILGLGSAILYLHQDWEQCVLHRDIKPSNVMLDASFSAKLGDFGLARLVDHGRRSHTTVLAGTLGYMGPECIVTGSASKESDVYRFGVVILETCSGRHPIMVVEGLESATMHLVQWVWEFYGQGRILDATDDLLNGEFDREEMERMLVTALWCAHPDRTMRPSIRQAVTVLRLEAPLPSLPSKMPVAMFMPPVDGFMSESSAATGSSSSGNAITCVRA